jgi:hypothetical protein
MSTASVVPLDLSGPGHYVHLVGPIQISVGNLVVIVLMIVVFALAILLPFPKGKK